MKTLTTPAGSPGARIVAIGEHRPTRIVTNEEICRDIDSTDAWIRERSGIITRRFAAPDESVVDMATSAASKALASSGVAPADVDLVLLATCTHPYQTPGGSSEVQDRLGAINAGAMDINAACAGFAYALSVANDAVRAGSARHVVVIGSEKMSDFIDPHDRGMAFLFGDGAGAAIVSASPTTGIGPVVWGSDGSHVMTITQEPNYTQIQHALATGGSLPPAALKMAGQTVFRWAVTKMAPVAQRALDAAGVSVDELGAFIPHQANLRIVESLVKSLKLPDTVAIGRDMETQGNTSSASIPLALSALLERGEVHSGQPALFIGFGAGLTYAAQVIEVP
ncbi:MAG TPA: beta-ketoacyl-ACP synthase III [Acidothermaceae bacterium]|nr:beta-ketoacyl-ACP synthase III [Acidothermaceae bacterium]